MTPEQANQLGLTLKQKREQQLMSVAETARQAKVDVGTVWRIEEGQISNPKPETLQAIGDALGIRASDLFATAGWMPPAELPTIRPYLRAKYRTLPAAARHEIEAQFDAIARKHGFGFDPQHGPTNGEDE